MATTDIAWPRKTREMHTMFFDSSIWNEFDFRDDDIIIGTYAKSGTTWVQQIIGQMLFGGQEGLPVADMSPWLDFTLPSRAQKRALARHGPIGGIAISSTRQGCLA